MKNAITKITAVTCLTLSLGSFAGQNEINKIEDAAATQNIATLATLSQNLDGYDKALALYRLSMSYNLDGKTDEAKDTINLAMEQLEKQLDSQPDRAEYLALLAQIYGYKISMEPMKGMYYGPKANRTLATAEEIAPNNPRVHLFKSISKFNTPAMFGGSLDDAFTAINKAILAFDEDQHSDYHWGFAEAYTWRGLIQYRQGKKDLAKKDWERAIALDPNYEWPKNLISKVN